MSSPLWLRKLLIRSGVARFLPVANRLTDRGSAYLKYYSDKVLAAPVEELLDPAIIAPEIAADTIDLNQSAPRFESNVSLGRVSADRRGHPPARGKAELRDAITDLYVRRDGRDVDPDEEVLITHGASAAYAAVLDAFVNPGDRVVLFDPCSPLFSLGASSRRANVRWVSTWTEDGRTRFIGDAFERAARGAKLIVLSEPGNPNGGCFASEDLEHIAWISNAYDVLIYADESFVRFRYDGRCRSIALFPGAEKRTLVAGSVSQGHGLGSLRVGWLVGPKHLIRPAILTASLSAPYVPSVCQRLAVEAIAAGDAEFEEVSDQFRSKRQYTCDRLRSMGLEAEWPGGGYFIWVSMAGLSMDGRAFANRLLLEQKVAVGPGCAFGPSGNDHIRISFATDDGRLREGLARLSRFVSGLKQRASQSEEEVSTFETESIEEIQPVFSRV